MSDQKFAAIQKFWGDLAQNIPIGIILVERGGIIRGINQVALASLELNEEEILGQAVWDDTCTFLGEDKTPLAPSQCPVHRVLSTGAPLKNQTLGFCSPSDLTITWFQMNAVPVAYSPGAEREVLVSLMDITPLKSAEHQLAQIHRVYEKVERIARFGSWYMDFETEQLFWSDEFREIFGFAKDEDQDYPAFLERIHPSDRSRLRDAQRRLLTQGTRLDLEYRILRPGGEVRHVRELSEAHFNSKSRMDHVHGFVLDITERRNQRSAIGNAGRGTDLAGENPAEADSPTPEYPRQKDQPWPDHGASAAGIAHEFNNTFAAALGSLELCLLDLPAESDARSSIEEAIAALRHAAALAQQMASQPDAPKALPHKTHLSEVIRSCQDEWRDRIPEHVRLKLILDEALPWVDVDTVLVQQALHCLFRNSADSLPDSSGSIFVRTYARTFSAAELQKSPIDTSAAPGNYVVLEVADNGKGIEAKTLSRMFEPAHSPPHSDKGSGLSSVVGVVRDHRGILLIDSRVSQGTTTKLLFPPVLTRETVPPCGEILTDSVQAAEELPDKNGRTVLLVEDEKSVRVACRLLLKRLDYQVITAASGDEALGLFHSYHDRIGCVLLDMVMPEKSGAETFAELQRIDPTVPVILTSGYPKELISGQFTGAFPDAYLHKPYSMESLEQMLDLFIDP